MPYKNIEKKREYQRNWVAQRRDEYFQDKSCVRCGNHNELELDHIDPNTKVSHSIWSWSKERREKELAKCQVLCHTCHKEKTNGIDGDLHYIRVGISENEVCSRGHDLKLVGFKKNTKPNGFVSKQCSYCGHLQNCKRRNTVPMSYDDFVAKRQ